ncbi:hypothetical protein [Streptomyces lavendulae]|uniref:hypothetical protein n=1 Tax=Streptomyces lavendulae TaxID=1914 RepID=UPI0024A41879|nr:hypothetical protein [Streptomyces lavendulae]GLX19805.1 hypothetical protein Slala01_34490 [Streptomyces lavendulae subsp. lavendulae]GLX27301.1 hypothetical protein Slala02_31210 [Streptomyces lavendulae subsp. lavendulae]
MVHGIWNHAPGFGPDEAARLKAERALPHLMRGFAAAGLATVPAPGVAVAYYADLLRPDTPPEAQAADGEPGFEVLSEDERDLVARWLGAAGAPAPAEPQNVALAPLRQILGWLVDDRCGGVAQRVRAATARQLERVTVAVLREVRAYQSRPGRRERVRERVAAVVRAERPRVIVAHSLGSLVAYETLHAYPELEVDQLVTLGSPLRLPALARRLDPGLRGGRGARPPGVRHWTNIADIGDLVAVPPKLSEVFPVDQDETVDTGLDFHGLHAYLAHGLTALAIAPYLP